MASSTDTAEDALWLLEQGESVPAICGALGKSPAAIAIAIRRTVGASSNRPFANYAKALELQRFPGKDAARSRAYYKRKTAKGTS